MGLFITKRCVLCSALRLDDDIQEMIPYQMGEGDSKKKSWTSGFISDI